jgi:hypothetical protein
MVCQATYDSFRAEIRELLRESERQRTVGATLDERNALAVRLNDALNRLYEFTSRNPSAGQINESDVL